MLAGILGPIFAGEALLPPLGDLMWPLPLGDEGTPKGSVTSAVFLCLAFFRRRDFSVLFSSSLLELDESDESTASIAISERLVVVKSSALIGL